MTRILKLCYWAITLQLPSRIRERRVVRRLRASGLFDSSFYRDRYSDVASGGIDPLMHYVRDGAAEGRDPNPRFNTCFYLESNPDVRESGMNPLDHFHSHGWLEGRNPHPLFDVAFYLRTNPDVADSGTNPLHHYIQHGETEGRRPTPLFEATEKAIPDRGACGLGLEISADADASGFGPRISIREIEPQAGGQTYAVSDRTSRCPAAADPIVVCISHVLPFPPRAGNEYRIYRYLGWLESRGYQVIMVCSPLPGEEASDLDLSRAAGELRNLIYCDRGGELRVSLASHFEHLIEGLDGQTAVSTEGREFHGLWRLHHLRRLCRRLLPLPEGAKQLQGSPAEGNSQVSSSEMTYCPDVLVHVLLHLERRLPSRVGWIGTYVFNTRYFPLLGPGALKLLDTIDVFSTMSHKVQSFGVEDCLALSEEDEHRLLLRADVVMAIQPDEARELARIAPERPVITVGVDFDPAPEANVAMPEAAIPPTVLLIASGNPLNGKGLLDFLRFAWPFVLRDHPEARLVVAGAVSEVIPDESPGVSRRGFVAALDELYRDCHLVINPCVAGTGLKIKTLEALAHHRPIVTWPAGVDGLSPELRNFCAVASDWYEFYLEVSKKLTERRREAFSREERNRIAIGVSGSQAYRLLGEVLDRHLREQKLVPGTSAVENASVFGPAGGSP